MYKAAIIVLVINNGMFGTIRMHQVSRLPLYVQRFRTVWNGPKQLSWHPRRSDVDVYDVDDCRSVSTRGVSPARRWPTLTLQRWRSPTVRARSSPLWSSIITCRADVHGSIFAGGHGETVVTTAEFAPAWERSVASGLPSIIEVTPRIPSTAT